MAKATRLAYGEKLADLIKENEKIVVLDADLTKSTMTILAKNEVPERHFNLGIAEANMIGVSAGLASSGYTVFASTFSMFATGRCWEQIRNSLAYPNLNVKVCGTHAGIAVGEDGVSHQAIEDIAIMKAIPNMKVYSPCDEAQTKALIEHVSKEYGPCYVRLGRANAEDVYPSDYQFDFSKINVLKKGSKIAVFTTGMMTNECLKAYELLKAQGLEVTIVDVCSIKPLDEEGVKEILANHEVIVTVEEHNVIGGLGSAIAEVSVKYCPRKFKFIGMQDRYAESGPFNQLLEKYHLNAQDIAKEILSL